MVKISERAFQGEQRPSLENTPSRALPELEVGVCLGTGNSTRVFDVG